MSRTLCSFAGGFSARVLTLLALVMLLPGAWAQDGGGAAPSTAPLGGSVPAPTAGVGQLGTAQQTGAGQNGNGQTGSRQGGNGQNGTGTNTQTQRGSQDATQQREGARRTADEDRAAIANVAQDQPTQFQLLVQGSTGTQLPIFGANLFFGVPSTFAQVQDVPVGADYVIGPGDVLQVTTFGQLNRQNQYTVDRTGDISVLDVGTVHVAGLRYDQLTPFLKGQLSRVFRNFDLTVNLAQLRSLQVFVVGEARRPGAYTVSSLSTLLNALFVSGGPLPEGSLRDIQILRGGRTVVHFDLYDLLLRGDKSHDVRLEPGDVLFIPPVGAQAAIAGSVTTPAIYEILPGTTIADLIKLAGGETSVALGTRVRVERIYEHTMRYLLDVDSSKDGGAPVANGDVITVGAILDRYRDSVTLRGNVAYPGRYVWHPGLRLTDLVPSKDVLITRDYYRRRNALGSPAADVTAQGGNLQVSGNTAVAQANDRATQSGTAQGATSTSSGGSVASSLTSSNSVFPAANDVLLSAPDIDWSYAVIERLNAQTLKTALIPFNPGKLFLEGDQSQNLELQSGDVITFFSTADVRVPVEQQTRFVRLEGEFVAAGVYSVEPGETLRQLLVRAGGLTPDAYLYGSDFTRQSTRRVQQQRLNEYADNLDAQVSAFATSANSRAVSDLDAAAASASVTEARQSIARLRQVQPTGRIVLQLKPDSRTIDAIPDLPLEDGDRFIVPRVPTTVSVEGQVYSANAFVFERGLKASSYLKRAGGPDRESDRKRLFILRADGSVYSRQYGDVERATVFPGDTIVVPPQLARRAFLRDLVDVSSVIGQLGVGIAAINLLHN